VVPHPVDAGYRYRVEQFLPYLESAGYKCTVYPFSTRRLYQALQSRGHLVTKILQTLYCAARRVVRLANLSQFDLVVIHREAFPFFVPTVEKWILRRHPRVIFSFDDATYSGHHDPSKLNHPLLYRFKYGQGVNEVLRRSLHIIAGNRILADYAKELNSNVSVVPTVVDCSRFLYGERGPAHHGRLDWQSYDCLLPFRDRTCPEASGGCESWPSSVLFFWTSRIPP
jgi:hypothetical protein